tara:strand:+ start:2524 stop:3426 length:903 start_codon:yes stop_codon:yes gene_type:complete
MKYKFNNIGLSGYLDDQKVVDLLSIIEKDLKSNGLEIFLLGNYEVPKELNRINTLKKDKFLESVDLIVAIGGDGTLLSAARDAAKKNIPLIGVNLGRLGFLNDISPNKSVTTILDILKGNFISEERIMLNSEITFFNEKKISMLALNEVSIKAGGAGYIQDFITYIDGEYVNTHEGDGLIIATPTGSTAYALSCGGPIIQPNLDAFVIVPVCPHTLSDRPLVIKSSSLIEIKVAPKPNNETHVACDGDLQGSINTNDKLVINIAKEKVTLLHPNYHNYYEKLRSKLNWGYTNRVKKNNAK